MQLRVVVALVSWVVAVRAPTPADACAPAPPHGEEVRIAEEEAIILWDPKAKVEHFIRRAAFRSTARSFGFLVPTPTTPTLGEVADGAFATLAERTKPEVRRDKVRAWELGSWLLDACAATAQKKGDSAAQVTSAPNAVRVIATAQVAGFDATTLEADDAGALAAWLGKHGFAATPELTAWLARYVEQKWKITAFVVATEQREAATQFDLATRVVRMTFHTDRPFYPYREPAASKAPAPSIDPGSRLLRVHFLSTERHAATLAGEPWSARVLFAAPVAPVRELAGLGDQLASLTTFVDESYPRRGIDEVYFAPGADRTEVRQPAEVIVDRVVTTIPLDLILVLGVIAFLTIRHLRRPRRVR